MWKIFHRIHHNLSTKSFPHFFPHYKDVDCVFYYVCSHYFFTFFVEKSKTLLFFIDLIVEIGIFLLDKKEKINLWINLSLN